MKNLTITLVLVAMCHLVHAGGPWPQPKGQAYIKLSEWWTVFDKHYTDNGMRDPNLTTGIFNTTIYAEYGVTDRFTAVLNAPIFSRSFMNNQRSGTTEEIIINGEAINSIGDIDIGLKYGLTRPGANIPVAVSLTLGLPTGVSSGGQFGSLQTGDGEFNQYLKIDAGKSFAIGSAQSYVSLYTGVNNRGQDFSEEFRIGGELGVGLANSKFWLTGKLDILRSFKNSDRTQTINSTSIFANNAEFVSLGLEANVYVTRRAGISAGFATAVSGSIIAAAPSYSVGVFYDMSR
jgi:hypothetical protein